MSVFDKYNVNPYVSTYAGAPIAEYQQAAGALQQRMDQNLAKSDQIEIAMKNLEVADVDEDFKAQKIKEYQAQLEEIAQAPEYATSKIRALSKQFATDEGLKEAQANKQRIAAIQKEISEGDYSDFQVRKFNEELKKYKEKDEQGLSGIAAGRRFGSVNFYEERDLNTETLDQVKGILGEKFGDYSRDSQGNLVTTTGEQISENRVRGVAQGMLSNNKVMRQVADEYRNAKGLSPNADLSSEEHSQGLQEFFDTRYVDPAIAKFVKTDERQTAKTGKTLAIGSWKPDGSLLGNSISVPRTNQLIKSDFSKKIELSEAFNLVREYEKKLEEGTYTHHSQVGLAENTITELKGSLRRVLTNEDIIKDPQTREIMSNAETDDELWNLVNRAGKREELDGVFNQMGSIDDFDFNKMQKLQVQLTEDHGAYVSGAFVNAVNPKYLRTAARNQLRYQINPVDNMPYHRRIPEELIQKTMEEIKQEKIEEIKNNYDELVGDNTTRVKDVKNYLIKQGMDEAIAGDRALDVVNSLNGNMFKTTYSDALKDGILDVATERYAVNANSVLSDSNINNLSRAISSVFDQGDAAKTYSEAFEMLDPETGVSGPISEKVVKELVDKYDISNMKLDAIDATNGMGFVEVLVPPNADNKGLPAKRLALDLDGDLMKSPRQIIAESAKLKAIKYGQMLPQNEVEAERLQREIQQAKAIELNFSSPEVLQEIIRASELNTTGGNSEGLIINNDFILNSLGNVYAKKTPDGKLYFENQNGDNIIGVESEFTNVQQAWSALMKKAEKTFSDAGDSLKSA